MYDVLSLVTSRWPIKSRSRRELEAHLKQFPYHAAFSVDGRKWYCYDDLTHVSKGRASQINAIVEQAKVNLTEDDVKQISLLIRDMIDLAHAEMLSMQAESVAILEGGGIGKQPPERITTLLKRMATLDLVPLKVASRIMEEISKRMELLAHVDFLHRLAAVLFWTDGEDPRLMLEPDQINRKADYLKKKGEGILLRLLMTPVSDMLYHLDKSKQDSVTSLMMALAHQQPFLKFTDLILKQAGMRYSQSGTTPSTELTENKQTPSGLQAKIRTATNDGSQDLKSFFTSTLEGPKE